MKRVSLVILAALVLASAVVAGETESKPFLEGENHREAGRWEAAADAYWKAIEADRDNYMAHVRYQEVSLKQGVKLADLVADYKSFVTDFPDDVAMKLHRLRLEPPDKRVQGLKLLQKEHPEARDRVEFETALLDRQQGEIRDVLKDLRGPVKAGDPYALAMEVKLLAAEGKLHDAEKAAKDALDHPAVALAASRVALLDGRYDDALERVQTVLTVRPESPAALLVKAEALDGAGKRDEAIATLVAARRLSDDAAPVLLALADLRGRPGDEEALKQAAAVYDDVLKKDGENARALYGLAWVREREQKYSEAEELYRKALAVQPTDVSTIESVGWILFKVGRVTDAQIQFRKAIDLDSNYASAYANMGATHDAKAEYAKAIEWYEKLLKLPGQKDNIRGLVNCAFDYEQLGTFPKAEDYLRRAVDIRPKDPDLRVWLGDNLYFQEKYRDAEKSYLEAIDLDAKSFYAWRGLGLTFGAEEKWNDAANAFEKARKLKAEDSDILFMLGNIYLYELEDLEKALDAFLAYVAVGGSDPDVPKTIVEIRKQLK